MSFQGKSLQCSDCGNAFTFTAEEQESYQSKGYVNEPKRCPECREARKSRQNQNQNQSRGSYMRKQMYPVVCAGCGKETEVPFEPRGDRPVYCSDCYRKVRN